MRRAPTLAERRLWAELRKLKLNFRRQVPIGRYIADFASHGATLIIEIDSARHDLPEAQLYDLERKTWLESQGYQVVRFRNDEVLADPIAVALKIKTVSRGIAIARGHRTTTALTPARGEGE